MHVVRDEEDFRRHVAYCWGNPVKHAPVARTVDWPYSSIHRDIRLGRVDPEWAGEVTDGGFDEREAEDDGEGQGVGRASTRLVSHAREWRVEPRPTLASYSVIKWMCLNASAIDFLSYFMSHRWH